jgi:hypothetical protein
MPRSIDRTEPIKIPEQKQNHPSFPQKNKPSKKEESYISLRKMATGGWRGQGVRGSGR